MHRKRGASALIPHYAHWPWIPYRMCTGQQVNPNQQQNQTVPISVATAINFLRAGD